MNTTSSRVILITTSIILLIYICYTYGWVLERFTSELMSNNTTKVCSKVNGGCYRVQNKYDPNTFVQAADLLDNIHKRNIIFFNHLKKKYLKSSAANNNLSSVEFKNRKDMVRTLLKRYNPDVIVEHSPKSAKNTSYVWAKGGEIGFCLRERETGENNIHTINTVYFVNLHELTHLASREYNGKHTKSFWSKFKFILSEAVEAGVYSPVDYSVTPMNYCGVSIYYSPLYDGSL